jgi:hypothetical protein
MQDRRAFLVVFAIAAALIIPAALTLRTVVHPVILQATSDNPTPLGYTWSLLLFIIPIGALGWWFASRPDLQFPRKAFRRTIAVLTPLGFLLDLLLGNTFSFFRTKPPHSAGKSPRRADRFRLKNSFSTSPGSCWCC